MHDLQHRLAGLPSDVVKTGRVSSLVQRLSLVDGQRLTVGQCNLDPEVARTGLAPVDELPSVLRWGGLTVMVGQTHLGVLGLVLVVNQTGLTEVGGQIHLHHEYWDDLVGWHSASG